RQASCISSRDSKRNPRGPSRSMDTRSGPGRTGITISAASAWLREAAARVILGEAGLQRKRLLIERAPSEVAAVRTARVRRRGVAVWLRFALHLTRDAQSAATMRLVRRRRFPSIPDILRNLRDQFLLALESPFLSQSPP